MSKASPALTTHDASPPRLSRAEARRIAQAALQSASDADDAAARAAATSDPDAQPIERLKLRPVGRPPLANRKRSVHLRLDREVVEAFEADGPGWQTRMNAALRKAAGLE